MHLQHSIYIYIWLSSSYRDDIYTSNPTFSPFYLHASDNFFFLNLSRDPWPLVNSCNMDANRPPGLSCQADPVRTLLFLIQNLHITISFFLYGSYNLPFYYFLCNRTMKHADWMARKYLTMSSTASALSSPLVDLTGMGPTRLAKKYFYESQGHMILFL